MAGGGVVVWKGEGGGWIQIALVIFCILYVCV